MTEQRAIEQRDSRQVRNSLAQKGNQKVSKLLAKHIADLHRALTLEFGVDFAYSISSHGKKIAASNYYDGYITPNEVEQ